MKKIVSFFKSGKRKSWLVLGAIAIILIVVGLATASTLKKGGEGLAKPGKNLSQEEASAKAEQFINDFLMTSGSKATIKEISSEYGLYKVKIDIVTDVVESYLTKDGRLFFPQALNIDEIYTAKDQAGNENNSAPVVTVNQKSDKPVVELFVMSHCPYGTQIEKGILPVVETLGDKIDFQLKFCGYAMHGEKELKEQLVQYCIMEEEPKKFNDYLECFLGSSDSAACLKTAKVDEGNITSCVAKTDAKFKVMDNFKNKVDFQGSYPSFNVFKADNEKYGVGGSPTLVINGEEIRSGRDSASLLATICSAFNEAPEACATELSSTSPSAGFGYSTNGNASEASCN